jgi:dual-specificity kinase
MFADKILQLLGKGTFGQVVECWDRDNGERIAVKIIRAIPKYREAARKEVEILRTIQQHDADSGCVRLLGTFDFRDHVCMCFELLSISVFDFMKNNDYEPFPLRHIRHFTIQIFRAVAFLHDLTIVHTDLKPENILLVNSECKQVPSIRRTVVGLKRRKTSQSQQLSRQLLQSEIKLIDLGSAIFDCDSHPSVISTRYF